LKLRDKTLLIIVVTLVILTLFLDLFSRAILLNSFEQLQAEAVQQNLQRAQRLINMRIWQLDSTLSDWAPWDDTYQFVIDQNSAYVDANLADETLINLHVDFMIFMNSDGKVVYAKAVDFASQTETGLPPDLYQHIAPNKLLVQHATNDSSIAGILQLASGPTIVASQPITMNNREGAILGTLIFGRYLNDDIIQRVGEELELSVAVEPYNNTVSADFTHARAIFTETPAPVIPLDEQNVAGYATLLDIYGEPALIVRVDTPNKIAQQGQASFSFFMVALLVSGLAVGLSIIYLLEKYVLSRLADLNKQVGDIRSSASFNQRVNEKGSDELSGLGHSVNMLLESIETSQRQLQNLNLELEHSLSELRLVQEQKDRFFTHAGHEFRTPLANLRTRLYLARKQPDHLDHHLLVLEHVTDQMTTLVEDIFDVSRYGKRSLELSERKIELQDMMQLIFSEQGSKAEAKKVNFSHTMVEENAFLYADSEKLKQAVSNVFSYAINFTNPGSAISTQVTTLSDEAIIQIDSDNIDIKAESVSQIFQPFFRASEGGAVSTALSLTLAKEIIELHFGRITYEANGQTGGTFTIKLLLMDESNSKSGSEPVLLGVIPD
jgi:sensor domain CHASE-containing protein/nitrogen-specific signal transduction histidine kinase